MKSLVRRIAALEQHAEAAPISLPPLPPMGASEAELQQARAEAWQQFQAHPDQGWGLYLIRLAQRGGIKSKVGAESFREDAGEKDDLAD